jgi:P27 family predicted phage terminase small subunit
MKKPDLLPAPTDLGEHGAKMWEEILAVWDFSEEPDNIRILESACRCWDQFKLAEAEVRKTGLLVRNRYNCLTANPALDVQRRSHVQFLTALKQLGMEYPIEQAPRRRPGRPPNRPRGL